MSRRCPQRDRVGVDVDGATALSGIIEDLPRRTIDDRVCDRGDDRAAAGAADYLAGVTEHGTVDVDMGSIGCHDPWLIGDANGPCPTTRGISDRGEDDGVGDDAITRGAQCFQGASDSKTTSRAGFDDRSRQERQSCPRGDSNDTREVVDTGTPSNASCKSLRSFNLRWIRSRSGSHRGGCRGIYRSSCERECVVDW